MEAVGSSGFPQVRELIRSGRNFESEQTHQVAATYEKQAGFSILTAEGDRVTISSGFSQSYNSLTYNRYARTNDGESSVKVDSRSFSQSESYSIAVEGDLSEQELADIKNLVQKVDKLSRNLFSGKLDEALNGIQDFGNLGTLTSFEANVTLRQSIQVSEQQVLQYHGPHLERESLSKEEDPEQALDKTLKKIFDAIENSNLTFDKLHRPLRSLFNRLEREFAKDSSDDPADDSKKRKHPDKTENLISRLAQHVLGENLASSIG